MAEELPLWYAFGPLGWSIGHELGHALIDSLREISEKTPAEERNNSAYSTYFKVGIVGRNNSRENEISHGSLKDRSLNAYRFQPTMTCYREFFASLSTFNLRDLYFEEAICDHISLKVSMHAFKYYKKSRPTQFSRLPLKLLKADDDEMFFITRSYPMCMATNARYGWWDLNYPPKFYRTNRGLVNYPRFHMTFGCLKRDVMVSEKRCPFLWASIGESRLINRTLHPL